MDVALRVFFVHIIDDLNIRWPTEGRDRENLRHTTFEKYTPMSTSEDRSSRSHRSHLVRPSSIETSLRGENGLSHMMLDILFQTL